MAGYNQEVRCQKSKVRLSESIDFTDSLIRRIEDGEWRVEDGAECSIINHQSSIYIGYMNGKGYGALMTVLADLRPLTSDFRPQNRYFKIQIMTVPGIEILLEIVQESSKAILEIYNDKNLFNVVDFKADHSPLTLADKKSHEIITRGLSMHYPEIPILSEEGKDIPYEKRKNWEYFWLVDPLDGTKEFIKRNGEFTINIALIKNRYPVLGLIHVPAQDISYYGIEGTGAFKITGDEKIKLEIISRKKEGLTAVRSRSHASPEEEEFFKKNNVTNFIAAGSALKFCMVAEGKADIYYRHGPTMEWDTAAGQAIIEASGGKVLKADSGERFVYNKEELRNGRFVSLKN